MLKVCQFKEKCFAVAVMTWLIVTTNLCHIIMTTKMLHWLDQSQSLLCSSSMHYHRLLNKSNITTATSETGCQELFTFLEQLTSGCLYSALFCRNCLPYISYIYLFTNTGHEHDFDIQMMLLLFNSNTTVPLTLQELVTLLWHMSLLPHPSLSSCF